MEAIQKIDDEITKLYDINDKLIDIIAFAGRDSETHYTKDYWIIVDGAEALRKALQDVLNEHNDVSSNLDEWLRPLPVLGQHRHKSIKPRNIDFNNMAEIARAAGL